ncbi:vitamin B12 transport system substrate-binding protein [Ferrimonas sediminum]|uniref:Vitamin B12 transport system substrate-binding protein n=1 Tax=Ferrimonas sediminum TaxID=718193 RepID=A0A1G8WJW6_9GAMM|nr:cobalamin-binding protein [Ferrimonas sediminum]SDJ77935.1 vitamin B12 transport system substrate-binding protein [Ferrimonas sediminum]
MSALKWLWPLMLMAPWALAVPQKLVALSPHSVEMLFAIGAGDRIEATVDYADYPEAAQAIPRIGRFDYLNMEALMLLQPDLVVLSIEDTSAPLIERLRSLGLPVFDTSVTRIDEIADRLEQLGQALGLEAEGHKQAGEFRLRLAQLRQQYRQQAPVKVFYQVWPEPLTTVSGGWMNGILADCGADNVFADGEADYPQVSMEQVLVRKPEIILKPEYHGNSNQEVVDWRVWPEIPAVANDQIVPIEGDLVHRTGPRVLEGMALVCRKIDTARRQREAL